MDTIAELVRDLILSPGVPERKPWGTYEFAISDPDGALVRWDGSRNKWTALIRASVRGDEAKGVGPGAHVAAPGTTHLKTRDRRTCPRPFDLHSLPGAPAALDESALPADPGSAAQDHCACRTRTARGFKRKFTDREHVTGREGPFRS